MAEAKLVDSFLNTLLEDPRSILVEYDRLDYF